MNKLTDQPYRIAFNHRPIVREIRINRAYEMLTKENLNKSFSKQSGEWHDRTDRALTLLELI